MDDTLLRFHHFGLAVPKPDTARTLLTAQGYQTGETVFDPNQNVCLAMCRHESQPPVEIIWPGTGASPVDVLIRAYQSGIIYHLCYETSDLDQALAKFKADGLRVVCISPPKPAPLFGGRKVSFYNVVGMGLIEILEP